jgi:hypothetical protein
VLAKLLGSELACTFTAAEYINLMTLSMIHSYVHTNISE